ncbi:hypothetical protein QR680_000309 [Steinernema hermaphroditum]|uniref:Sugar phosphate transporter domain-containing protein n=1 Tax=Steinernema hermaphroditum TaxID=289476 RepID=A0AA39GVQ2_9BILA|nr:hypothetical protein QR680_000309 [Steinernema hermaphroditum]
MDSSSSRGAWGARGGGGGGGRNRGRAGASGGGANSKDPWKRQDKDEFRPQGPIKMAVRPSNASVDGDPNAASSPSDTPAFRILQPKAQSPPASSMDPTPMEAAKAMVKPIQRHPVQQSSSSGSVNGNSQTAPAKIAPTLKQTARPAAPMNAVRASCTPQNTMDLSVRLIDDNNEICDLNEFLTESTAYTVIGVIGPQGTGKSTLISMLAGNEPMDMYREYYFRPCSREAVESCLHQTTKISIYVGPDATMYVDCQPCMSPAILDEIIRQQRRGYIGHELTPEMYHEQESNRFLAFMYQICHTIILCIDWFIDVNLVRELRNVELLASSPLQHDRSNEMLRIKQNRKVNLVVAQQRCKVEDFQPVVVLQRSQILSDLFNGSRLKVDGGLTMTKLLRRWDDSDDPVQTSYVMFPDLKPRLRDGFHYGQSGYNRRNAHQPNYDPDRDPKNLKMGMVEYTDVLNGLRRHIKSLPKDAFTINGNRITEKQWFAMASPSSIVNKITLQQYPYPTTLALSSLISVSLYAVFLLSYWGIGSSSGPLTSYYLYRYIVPLSLGKALAAGSAYYGLWKVPVSYAHTIKATMPLFAVLMARVLLGEKQRPRVYLSLLPIVLGVTIASVTEVSFNLAGLLSSLFSTFVYSGLNVVVKKILKETDMHPLHLLSVNSQIAAIFLFPYWIFKDAFNLHYVISSGESGAIDSHFLVLLTASGFLSFAQNLCAFTLIHKLTALSYAVSNATKRVTVIGASLLTLRNPVTPPNLFGMFLSVFGVFLYNRAKNGESKRKILPVLSGDQMFRELLPEQTFTTHQHQR